MAIKEHTPGHRSPSRVSEKVRIFARSVAADGDEEAAYRASHPKTTLTGRSLQVRASQYAAGELVQGLVGEYRAEFTADAKYDFDRHLAHLEKIHAEAMSSKQLSAALHARNKIGEFHDVISKFEREKAKTVSDGVGVQQNFIKLIMGGGDHATIGSTDAASGLPGTVRKLIASSRGGDEVCVEDVVPE